jgi:hypothetical protein
MDMLPEQERLLQRKRGFLITNLAVKIPAQRSASLREEVENGLEKGLHKDTLKRIDNETNRFAKGHGEFGAVLDTAKKLGPVWEAWRTGGKLKVNTGLLSTDKVNVTPAQMDAQFTKLHAEAKQWADANTEAGDATRKAKQDACQAFMKLANQGRMAVRMKELAELHEQILRKNGTRDVVDRFRELDAEVLCLSDRCGARKAPGGTSDVNLIMGPDGKVAYAFKSVAGESSQMGSPKGAGALRECLASRLFEELDNKYNLNFDWPKTTLCKAPGTDGKAQLGVLIDGLPGQTGNKVDPSLLHALPDEAKQKFLLASMASVQLDTKWESAFVERTDAGVKMRPSDGGAIAPSEEMLMIQMLTERKPIVIGESLTEDNHVQPMASAKSALNPEVVDVFKKLDLGHLEGVMKNEMAEAKKHGLDADALGVAEGCKMMLESMGALKGILTADRAQPLTFEGLVKGYNDEFLSNYVKKRQPACEQRWIDQYRTLKAEYGNLLPDPTSSAGNLFAMYLQPDSLQRWKALHELNKEVDLAKLGRALPFGPTVNSGDAVAMVKKVKFAPEVKQRHPLIWPPKEENK